MQGPRAVQGADRSGYFESIPHAEAFVICGRGSAAEALTAMRDMMRRLKLTVHEAKTRLCHSPDEPFAFLGYTIGHRQTQGPATVMPHLNYRATSRLYPFLPV